LANPHASPRYGLSELYVGGQTPGTTCHMWWPMWLGMLKGPWHCRYKGDAGMKRWVGLGVIADNVINIGHAMEKQSYT
jgi:hypothetical protein